MDSADAELAEVERKLIAAIGGPEVLGPTSTFGEAGLDSLGLVSLSLAIEEMTGVKVPAPMLESIDTIREAAEWVVSLRR